MRVDTIHEDEAGGIPRKAEPAKHVLHRACLVQREDPLGLPLGRVPLEAGEELHPDDVVLRAHL